MAKYDRIEHLKQVHEARKVKTRKTVDNAIQRLIRANDNINFNSVAEEAGIAKLLYITIQKYENELNRYESSKPKFQLQSR